METVDVTQDEDGTRVVLRRTLGRARGMSDLARVAAEWHGDTPVGAVDGRGRRLQRGRGGRRAARRS